MHASIECIDSGQYARMRRMQQGNLDVIDRSSNNFCPLSIGFVWSLLRPGVKQSIWTTERSIGWRRYAWHNNFLIVPRIMDNFLCIFKRACLPSQATKRVIIISFLSPPPLSLSLFFVWKLRVFIGLPNINRAILGRKMKKNEISFSDLWIFQITVTRMRTRGMTRKLLINITF